MAIRTEDSIGAGPALKLKPIFQPGMADKNNDPVVGVLYDATSVPDRDAPYNTLQLRIYFPAQTGSNALQSAPWEGDNTSSSATPRAFPVVLILPGVGCESESYRTLVDALVLCCRAAVVVPSMIGQRMPARPALNDLMEAPRQGAPPWRPYSFLLFTVTRFLRDKIQRDESSPLKDRLDLSNLALVGHSMGGASALHCMYASEVLSMELGTVVKIRGVATYAAHGFIPTAVLQAYPGMKELEFKPEGHPSVLLISAEEDEIMRRAASLYGDGAAAVNRVQKTFDECFSSSEASEMVFFLQIRDTSHFSICSQPGVPNQEGTIAIHSAIVDFIRHCFQSPPSATDDAKFLCNPEQWTQLLLCSAVK